MIAPSGTGSGLIHLKWFRVEKLRTCLKYFKTEECTAIKFCCLPSDGAFNDCNPVVKSERALQNLCSNYFSHTFIISDNGGVEITQRRVKSVPCVEFADC